MAVPGFQIKFELEVMSYLPVVSSFQFMDSWTPCIKGCHMTVPGSQIKFELEVMSYLPVVSLFQFMDS